MLKAINETLKNDTRYSRIPWRRSGTANVIDRTTRSATAGVGGMDEDEEDRKPKKVKVSKEKASISVNELENTLVKAFNGGEAKLKKVSDSQQQSTSEIIVKFEANSLIPTLQITNDTLKDYLKQKSQRVSGLRKAEFLAMAREQLVRDGKLEPEE